ncbi:MAG: hypothetical protein K8E66_11120, partial [Phycisphaerales bacterium]|nr:hypothetical protein [Phycisphaerales bacterium]
FTPGSRLNDPAAWSADSGVVFSVTGRVRDRDHAQAFRKRLIDSGLYAVVSQGPEVEDRFALRIVTDAVTADAPEQIGGGP